jgi:hypothetical protein
LFKIIVVKILALFALMGLLLNLTSVAHHSSQ